MTAGALFCWIDMQEHAPLSSSACIPNFPNFQLLRALSTLKAPVEECTACLNGGAVRCQSNKAGSHGLAKMLFFGTTRMLDHKPNEAGGRQNCGTR